MPEIHVLSTHLVNKIAAGEVIERPASVVKELVENALDSGATRVEIAIEDGGKKLIQVSDDGCGMDRENLSLAFTPHATSKIRSDEDLFEIATMGFRGEALASIASISHAKIRSRAEGEDAGWEIEASGETVGDPKPTAASRGTTVTIRDLFFNTPARRKFMRTASTEIGHITEQLARVALPRPQVAFRLTHNGRVVHHLPAAESTRQRIADLFGSELAEGLLAVKPRNGEVSVRGYAGPPSLARSSSKWQYFFLNGRYVRDRLLAHALREAYRGRLDSSRSPVVMVFIEIDPGEVDVNVHPTKIEVRFRNSQLVHGSVLGALRDTLNASPASAGPEAKFTAEDLSDDQTDSPDDARKQSLREAMAEFFKKAPKPQPRLGFNAPGGRDHTAPYPPAGGSVRNDRPAPRPPEAPLHNRSATPEPADAAHPPTSPEMPGDVPHPQPAGDELARPARSMRPLLQVHNSYIVAQTADGVVIVDQHALHERICYNDFSRRLANGGLNTQRLLIPETVRVTGQEEALLGEHAELLRRLGIEVESFGPNTAAIQAFPTLLTERRVQAASFLRELLDELSDDGTVSEERLLEKVLAMMACKSAVKAGDPLTPEEMADLLARSDALDKRESCPHGRPTTLTLTLRELEKQFKRT
ncbi:MAG: DNA mismatch repair endonuclease MutL [Phycisphaerae bacterium]